MDLSGSKNYQPIKKLDFRSLEPYHLKESKFIRSIYVHTVYNFETERSTDYVITNSQDGLMRVFNMNTGKVECTHDANNKYCVMHFHEKLNKLVCLEGPIKVFGLIGFKRIELFEIIFDEEEGKILLEKENPEIERIFVGSRGGYYLDMKPKPSSSLDEKMGGEGTKTVMILGGSNGAYGRAEHTGQIFSACIETKSCELILEYPHRVCSLCFSIKNPNYLYFGGGSDYICVSRDITLNRYNFETRKVEKEMLPGIRRDEIRSIYATLNSRNEELLFCGRSDLSILKDEQLIRIIDFPGIIIASFHPFCDNYLLMGGGAKKTDHADDTTSGSGVLFLVNMEVASSTSSRKIQHELVEENKRYDDDFFITKLTEKEIFGRDFVTQMCYSKDNDLLFVNTEEEEEFRVFHITKDEHLKQKEEEEGNGKLSLLRRKWIELKMRNNEMMNEFDNLRATLETKIERGNSLEEKISEKDSKLEKQIQENRKMKDEHQKLNDEVERGKSLGTILEEIISEKDSKLENERKNVENQIQENRKLNDEYRKLNDEYQQLKEKSKILERLVGKKNEELGKLGKEGEKNKEKNFESFGVGAKDQRIREF